MTRMTTFCAVTAFAIGAIGTCTFALPASAQNAPPAASADAGNGASWGGQEVRNPGLGRHAHVDHHRWLARKNWGLFARVPDKQITTADTQIIAQGILLRHGNHTWKVADVKANADNTISFAFTTSDGGGVAARFTIDTRTGRIHRVS